MAVLKPLDTMQGVRERGLELLGKAADAYKACESEERGRFVIHGCEFAGMPPEGYARCYALSCLADVMQAVAGCLYAMGATPAEVGEAFVDMWEHNDANGMFEVEDANVLKVEWLDPDSQGGSDD